MNVKRVVFVLTLVISLLQSAQADDVYTWTGTASDDWMTVDNWDVATVPADGALGDDADVYIGNTSPLTWPVLDAGDVPSEIDDLWIANGSGLTGELLVQGGVSLNCGDDLKIGYEAGSVYAKLTVKGVGTTVLGKKSLELGESGTVVIDVDGGKLEIGQVNKPKWNMLLAAGADANVTIMIRNGGVLEHHGDYAEDERGGLIIGDGTVLIDIGFDSGSGGGTLKLKNDVTELVRTLSRDGVIVADGGTRDLRISFYDDYTHVTASELNTRLDPRPADGSSVGMGPAQLQWTLPEPSVVGSTITCDVYFGTHPSVESNARIVEGQTLQSVSVTLAPQTKYYWAMDLYDSSISTTDPFYLSPIFTFSTMNTAPVVNAGEDVATWLDRGTEIIQLAGLVSDEDGGPGPATRMWTVIAEPNALNPARLSDPQTANPALAVKETGSYTLQLEAGDGEYTTTDTVQIVLYADACEHARNQEGFTPLAGDTNNDCKVDLRDLANLGLSWLQENFSTR
jgi:hypothetical protein